MENLNIIVKMKFGSHLYGTADENSDLDYKGIYLPTKKQILLNRVKRSYTFTTKDGPISKNTKDDIDIEYYSLQYFIKLACEGQTAALDMLHAPKHMFIEQAYPIWSKICYHRKKFYTKRLEAFVGYARKQAAKYGIKGSRLDIVKRAIDILDGFDEGLTMDDIWFLLPEGEHSRFIDDSPNGVRQYQICGRILQSTQKIGYTLSILSKIYDEYGKRAQRAMNNEGIDWKAVSHAIRAAYQIKELFLEEHITFPLPQAKFLSAVKRGELDYQSEVAPKLEDLMDEVEELAKKSKFPEKADREFWDEFVIKIIEDYVL